MWSKHARRHGGADAPELNAEAQPPPLKIKKGPKTTGPGPRKNKKGEAFLENL